MMQNRPISVLMIEDDDDDYIITKSFLAGAAGQRFEVKRASSLKAGWALLGEGGVDVVLLDLSLPDSFGLETFSRTRSRFPHLPFLLLTGLADEAMGVKAVQAGAQDYLVKGRASTYELSRAIRYAIERKKTEEQVETYAQELRARNRQMEQDLDTARNVQRALLPQRYPRFPQDAGPDESDLLFCHLYRPCDMVGGDFFDVTAVSDSVAGIFICDVMGHGVQAALVTAIVRGLLGEMKPLAGQPGPFLSAVNQALLGILRQSGPLIFASAAYLTVDVVSGSVCAANAGHPDPILLRRRGGVGRASRIEATNRGPALGIMADHAYVTTCTRLEPTDRIVLFSDGLAEEENPEGDEYGEARLVAAVQARASEPTAAILDGVLKEVVAFAQGDEFGDDVCLLGVEVARLREQEAR